MNVTCKERSEYFSLFLRNIILVFFLTLLKKGFLSLKRSKVLVT